MPRQITELTKEQNDQIPAWCEKWIAIGLSTEPANFEAAEEGVRGCYHAAQLVQPQMVLRAHSPMAVALVGPIVDHMMSRLTALNEEFVKYLPDVKLPPKPVV
jgi:hypothetical protein